MESSTLSEPAIRSMGGSAKRMVIKIGLTPLAFAAVLWYIAGSEYMIGFYLFLPIWVGAIWMNSRAFIEASTQDGRVFGKMLTLLTLMEAPAIFLLTGSLLAYFAMAADALLIPLLVLGAAACLTSISQAFFLQSAWPHKDIDAEFSPLLVKMAASNIFVVVGLIHFIWAWSQV